MSDKALVKARRRIEECSGISLNLASLGLTSLPSELFELTRLLRLYLRNNELSTLPESIGHLKSLQTLSLSSNQLSTLPEVITKIPRVQRLWLSKNQLSMLPESIGQLTSLQGLVLDNNQLSTLPESFGQLFRLQMLGLSNNQLSTLPEAFGQLTSLQRLDLDGNQLSTLPESFGQLTSLRELHLHNNQLDIPEEILRTKSFTKIWGYYQEQQAKNAQQDVEFKVLLVGQGSVGKTHLLENLKLLQNNKKPNYYNSNEERTHSFNQLALPVASTELSQTYTANLWDFGGQNYLHSTHRFFLGWERSLYVLMLDATRSPNGDDNDSGTDSSSRSNCLNYWMRLIQYYGSDDQQQHHAPVIVIFSQCDAAERDEQEKPGGNYKANLEALEPWIEQGLVDRENIIEGMGWGERQNSLQPITPQEEAVWNRHCQALEHLLRRFSQLIPAIPKLEANLPASYFAIRQWVSELFQFEIDSTEAATKFYDSHCNTAYLELCDVLEQALAKENIETTAKTISENALEILHHVGMVHWLGSHDQVKQNFDQDHLQHYVFNPEWIKIPLYELIWKRSEKQGWLSREDLKERFESIAQNHAGLQRFGFDQGRDENYILSLMKACRIAFDVRQTTGIDGVLIPDLLSANHNAEVSANQLPANTPQFRYQLSAPFIPERVFVHFLGQHYHNVPAGLHATHYFRNEILYDVQDSRTPATGKIWIRTELSPPDGAPRIHLTVATEERAVADRLADKLLDEFNRIMEEERFARDQLMQLVELGEVPDDHSANGEIHATSDSTEMNDNSTLTFGPVSFCTQSGGLMIDGRFKTKVTPNSNNYSFLKGCLSVLIQNHDQPDESFLYDIKVADFEIQFGLQTADKSGANATARSSFKKFMLKQGVTLYINARDSPKDYWRICWKSENTK